MEKRKKYSILLAVYFTGFIRESEMISMVVTYIWLLYVAAFWSLKDDTDETTGLEPELLPLPTEKRQRY